MTDLPHEAELVEREPIFHHRELIWDEQSFDEQIAEDFSEIGASGTCYERSEVKEIVLGRLAGTHLDRLQDRGCACRPAGGRCRPGALHPARSGAGDTPLNRLPS